MVFWQIFFNFDSFSKIMQFRLHISAPNLQFRIQCHPWDPKRCVNSRDTIVLRFVFDFSAFQHHLGDFFHFSQIEARCHFYWFDMNISDNITFYSHNGWIFESNTSCECCNLKGIRANKSSVLPCQTGVSLFPTFSKISKHAGWKPDGIRICRLEFFPKE